MSESANFFEYPNAMVVQVDVHQRNVSQISTTAERSREYRDKKNNETQAASDLYSFQPGYPKTSAERMRAYRARKKKEIPIENLRKPKSNAERAREYRARKKAKTQSTGRIMKRTYTGEKKRSVKGHDVSPVREAKIYTEDVITEDERSITNIIIKTEPSSPITPNEGFFNNDIEEKFHLFEKTPIVYTTRLDDMNVVIRSQVHVSKNLFEAIAVESRPKLTPDSLKRKSPYVNRPLAYLQLKSTIQKANISVKGKGAFTTIIEKTKSVLLKKSLWEDPKKEISFYLYYNNYFVLRNSKTNEADFYYLDHKGTVTQHYITDQSVEDLHTPTLKNAEVSYCCWYKRKEYLTWMKRFLTPTGYKHLMKPHLCGSQCTCCCKNEISNQNSLNTFREPCNKADATVDLTTSGRINGENAEKPVVPAKLDVLVQQMFSNASSPIRSSRLLLKAFAYSPQKKLKVSHIIFTYKYRGNEYYEVGADGEIRQYLKNVTSFFKQECIESDPNCINENICCWYQREKYVQSLHTIYMIRTPKNMASRHSCQKTKCICCCKPSKEYTDPSQENQELKSPQQLSLISSNKTHVFLSYKYGGNDYYEIGPQAEIRQHWKNVSGFFKQECIESDQNSINVEICCWYQREKFGKSLETKYKLQKPKNFTIPHSCPLNNCICCCKPSENYKKKVQLEEIILPDTPNYSYKPCKKIEPLKFVFTTYDLSIIEDKAPKPITNISPEIDVENKDFPSLNAPVNKNVNLDKEQIDKEIDAAKIEKKKYQLVCENAKYMLENKIVSLKNIEVSVDYKGKVLATLNVPVTKLAVNELKIVIDILSTAQKNVDTLKKNSVIIDSNTKILNKSNDTDLITCDSDPQINNVKPKKSPLRNTSLYKSLSVWSKIQDESYLFAMKTFETFTDNVKKEPENRKTNRARKWKPTEQASEGNSKRRETSNEASSKPKRRRELKIMELAQINDQKQEIKETITRQNIYKDPVEIIDDDSSDDSVQFIDEPKSFKSCPNLLKTETRNDSAVYPVTMIAENTIDQEHLQPLPVPIDVPLLPTYALCNSSNTNLDEDVIPINEMLKKENVQDFAIDDNDSILGP